MWCSPSNHPSSWESRQAEAEHGNPATMVRRGTRLSSRTSTRSSVPYTLGEALGKGAFATVYSCTVGEDHRRVAAKVVSRKTQFVWIGGKSVESAVAYMTVLNEVAALRAVGEHAHVVGFSGLEQEDERALVFLELATGGDLQNVVESSPDGLPACTVAGHARGLLAALTYCHAMGVIHRDVKLANLLLRSDGTLLLSDFGHAAIVAPGTTPLLTDRNGTKPYCAPEIHTCGPDGYLGEPVDAWSAGVCLFALLSGRMPFVIADEIADWRFAKVSAAQAEGQSTCHTMFSWREQECPWAAEVVAFVDAMLAVDPARRPSPKAALQLAWLSPRRVEAYPVEAYPVMETPPLAATPMPLPLPPFAAHVYEARTCVYRAGSPGGKRRRLDGEADEERTAMWRGVETTSRAGVATAADYPSSSLRYRVMRRHGYSAAAPWLREEIDLSVPLIIEADRPFKEALANNNNYAWGGGDLPRKARRAAEPQQAILGAEVSRRSMPFP